MSEIAPDLDATAAGDLERYDPRAAYPPGCAPDDPPFVPDDPELLQWAVRLFLDYLGHGGFEICYNAGRRPGQPRYLPLDPAALRDLVSDFWKESGIEIPAANAAPENRAP